MSPAEHKSAACMTSDGAHISPQGAANVGVNEHHNKMTVDYCVYGAGRPDRNYTVITSP